MRHKATLLPKFRNIQIVSCLSRFDVHGDLSSLTVSEYLPLPTLNIECILSNKQTLQGYYPEDVENIVVPLGNQEKNLLKLLLS